MTVRKNTSKTSRLQRRFGIGEWYGEPFAALGQERRTRLAEIQRLPKKEKPRLACPFQSTADLEFDCTKAGGVCSLRLYERTRPNGTVDAAAGELGNLVTTCPNRFEEDHTIYRWVGETLLRCNTPVILKEIGFLESPRPDAEMADDEASKDVVGRIDRVLVVPGASPLAWCTLEVQAVYFQGPGMKPDFDAVIEHDSDTVPFPQRVRRPDYRSSGPKRLMPQLQIKVPSLRRWGKKMAVVVDESFFAAMGKMDTVTHVSNCDVAWFVIRYQESRQSFKLVPSRVHLTTLERSVEGLTAGSPVSLEVFEERILTKLKSSHIL